MKSRDPLWWVHLARARGFVSPEHVVQPEPGEPSVHVLGTGPVPVRVVAEATRAADKMRDEDLVHGRQKRISTFDVDCPQCEAVAGQPCWSAAGYPTDSHRRRVTARNRYNRAAEKAAQRTADQTWQWMYRAYLDAYTARLAA